VLSVASTIGLFKESFVVNKFIFYLKGSSTFRASCGGNIEICMLILVVVVGWWW
jgi:hypothetical protein